MSPSRIILESFDDETGRAAPYLSAEYKSGFEAGTLIAEEKSAAQHAQALDDIKGILRDMAFGYAEARRELLDQIRPILAQVAEVILPALAQETFSAHLIETLETTFRDATLEAVQVSVAPNMIALLEDAETAFPISSDPALEPGQALLRRCDTHIMIDLPTLTAALQEALRGLEATQRTHAHG